MPKFVFPLEALLRQRQSAERERQRELALCQAEMVRLQQELKQLNDELQGSDADMKANRLMGALDVAFLAAHRRYSLAMQRKGQGLVQDLARQQKRVDDAQRLLADAAKERKVIEKLREKQFERWRQEIERKEQAAADEAGAQFGYRIIMESSTPRGDL
jgi:flagellar FliJ protein